MCICVRTRANVYMCRCGYAAYAAHAAYTHVYAAYAAYAALVYAYAAYAAYAFTCAITSLAAPCDVCNVKR